MTFLSAPSSRPRSLVPLAAVVLGLTLVAGAPGAVAAPPPERPTTATDTRRAPTDLTVVTSNIDFTSPARRQRDQLEYVLRSAPDVVLLQEVRELDLRRPGGKVEGLGKYAVIQAWADDQPYQRASGILLRKSRFKIVDRGNALGYKDVPGVDEPVARYLPWAIAQDRVTGSTFGVVSVHMPIKSTTNANYERAYRQMLNNYVTLVRRLKDGNRQVITGGDWNQAVDRNSFSIDFDPVDGNKAAGLTLNWSYGDPCGSTRGKSRLDALGWRGGKTTLVKQGCLKRKWSDHRPVFAKIRY